MKRSIIAIDPGREKCGVAVMDGDANTHEKSIVQTQDLGRKIVTLIEKYPDTDTVVIGGGTGHKPVLKILKDIDEFNVTIEIVDEAYTTIAARGKYFEEHPPRGLMRLLPRGLRVPPRPVDDFAAVLIGEKYLCEMKGKNSG